MIKEFSLLLKALRTHHFAFAISAAVLLSACAGPAPDFTKIHVGMDKSEVIQRLGKPDSVSASGQSEYLVYGKWDDSPVDGRFGGGRYYVDLSNGKVYGYGKVEVPPELQAARDRQASMIMANAMQISATPGYTPRAPTFAPRSLSAAQQPPPIPATAKPFEPFNSRREFEVRKLDSMSFGSTTYEVIER
jgi:hypothetical protein